MTTGEPRNQLGWGSRLEIVIGNLRLCWPQAVIIGIISMLTLFAGCNPMDAGPTKRSSNIHRLGYAIEEYAVEHGSFPASDRGSEGALYLLKDKLPSNALDVPGYRDPAGPAFFDATTERVVHSGYIYLNKSLPPWRGGKDNEAVCVLVERLELVTSEKVWAVFANGLCVALPRSLATADILGRPLGEFAAAGGLESSKGLP